MTQVMTPGFQTNGYEIRNPSNAAPNVRAAPARAAAWQHGQAAKRAKIRLNGTGKMRVGIPYGFIKYTVRDRAIEIERPSRSVSISKATYGKLRRNGRFS